ncbi:MAG: thiamine pyrophosphate-dependent dehydrogenase E1 component subunit alpha [Verrucomicrobiota bacterium]
MSDIALRVSTPLPARESFVQAFRWMLLARLLEEKLANLYRAGKINGGVFLGKGQEALSASLGMALQKGDIFAPLIRDQAGRLAFGEEILDAVRTYLGSKLGPMRGREGNVHRGSLREGRYAMISHLGAMISAVCGGLMARRFQGQTGVVGATCVGDGCTSTGAFHEALNLAAVEKLPLVLIVANNQFAYSTPNDREFACTNLVDRALGYGIEGHTVDATELDACLDVVGRAVARARGGGGPQMVVATLLRLAGHGEHDDAAYIPQALKDSPAGRDCLRVAECALLERAWASAADLEAWREATLLQVEEAVATVQREPAPDPAEETWCALSTPQLDDTFAAC